LDERGGGKKIEDTQDNNDYLKYFYLFFMVSFILLLITKNIYCADKSTIEEKPVAVMIGNSPDEWSVQKGLSKAEIVYEIAVEFPFTRFVAFFLGDIETVVGPVRSSRYYFSRICAEWAAIFAHCGGQNLKNRKVLDIDQMNYPSPFWRDKNIGGWINLFVNPAKLRDEASKQNKSVSDNQNTHHLLNFRKSDMNNWAQIRKITIKYHADYIVSYEYHNDEKRYYRYINQKPHMDQGNHEQIKVSNIIIQYSLIEKIDSDDLGRVRVELIGEGNGRVFYEGTYQLVKWVKKNKDEQTFFLNKEGSPIMYTQGTTWIHLLPPESEMWFK